MSDFPETLRMSALRLYLQCPKRFELQILAGEKGEPKSERLRVGTALDRVVRHWAQQKRDEGLTPSTEQAEIDLLLTVEYAEARDQDDYAPASAGEQHIYPAASRIAGEIGVIIAKVNPVLVDERLSRWLTTASGDTLEVTGTLDLTYTRTLEPHDYAHHLRDVKMSGKAGSSWSAETAAQDFQLRTYTWLAETTDTPIDTQGWIVGRALKRDTQVLHEAADVTDAAVVQTGENLAAVASAIEVACESGQFLPTAALEQHWSCQAAYCPLWERVCPHGRRARTSVFLDEAA